jgi:hypothetical protein
MLIAIKYMQRPTTPVGRLTAALPSMPGTRRQLHAGTGAILRPVLLALLIGISAVIFRDKLASIVSRGDGGTEQAPDAGKE